MMGRSSVRWLRVAVAAGVLAGSALVSSTVMATDESPPVDDSALVAPVDVADASTPDPTPADPVEAESVDAATGGGVLLSIEAPSEIPFEDIEVIEMVMVELESTDPVPNATEEAEPESTEIDATEPVEPESTESEADQAVSTASPLPDAEMPPVPVSSLDHPDEPEPGAEGESGSEGEGEHDDEGGHEDEGGHDGGSGGQGSPYLMTFEVIWLDPDEQPIDDLDRSLFELSADSQTGSGKPTSATCTYPDGGSVLECTFVNKGHGSGSEGLIIPASRKATYTVTVVWPLTDWTIEGADDGVDYSARDLCPRDDGGDHGSDGGGHGSDGGGHGSDGGGHGSDGGDHGSDGGERRTVPCVHTVTMRLIAQPSVPEPEPEPTPAPEPVAPVVPEQPVVPDEPAAIPPVVSPPEVESAPVAVASQSALPATGGSVSLILVLAGLLVAVGASVSRFSRRTT